MRRRHIVVNETTLCGWGDMTQQELRHQKKNDIHSTNCKRCIQKHDDWAIRTCMCGESDTGPYCERCA